MTEYSVNPANGVAAIFRDAHERARDSREDIQLQAEIWSQWPPALLKITADMTPEDLGRRVILAFVLNSFKDSDHIADTLEVMNGGTCPTLGPISDERARDVWQSLSRNGFQDNNESLFSAALDVVCRHP